MYLQIRHNIPQQIKLDTRPQQIKLDTRPQQIKLDTRPQQIKLARHKTSTNQIRRQGTYRNILCGLAVVLQDDGDVHVDDDEEADDEVGEQVGDGHHGVTAVTRVASLRVR